MKRQAFLFLCALPLTQACVLNLEVLDGVSDEQGESMGTDTGTDTDEDTIDGESSSTDAESSSSSTDAESSSTDAETSSSTDAETSSTDEFGTSDAPPDCEQVQVEYEELVTMTECSIDADCKIINGHCSVGLGGCYYAVNASVDEAFLDTLAQIWSDGGCTQGVCDCAAPPASAICDAGTCLGVD